MEASLPRKLAVIVHADVVGSTGLVRRHESVAHQRMQAAFKQLSEVISYYHGSTHELRGDALVAEFSRASDAVCAALAFQAANRKHNQTLSDDIRPELRVGISLGEVVIADGTMTGAGVVLAQRLEQLAKPGAVIVQGAISEAIPDRLSFERTNLGDQTLKGFDVPVRVFEIGLAPGQQIPQPEPAADAAPPGGRPSIAVLPFTNISAGPDQDFLSDGLSNDLATFLSKFRRFSVTPSQSTFAYKGKSTSIEQVSKELAVGYVLEGSVQWAAERLRVSVQLSDSVTNQQIWAERYKRDGHDSFDVQDELVEVISATVAHKIDSVEAERGLQERGPNTAAYDYYMRGREIFFSRTKQTIVESRRLMKKPSSWIPRILGLTDSWPGPMCMSNGMAGVSTRSTLWTSRWSSPWRRLPWTRPTMRVTGGSVLFISMADNSIKRWRSTKKLAS